MSPAHNANTTDLDTDKRQALVSALRALLETECSQPGEGELSSLLLSALSQEGGLEDAVANASAASALLVVCAGNARIPAPVSFRG